MIQLFSTNTLLKSRLNSINIPFLHVKEYGDIQKTEVIVADADLAEMLVSYRPDFLVLALTPSPNFTEGTRLLSCGIKGYGNSFMHAKHLRRAIVTIKEGNVWLSPSFMHQLIAHVAIKESATPPSRLSLLTQRQQETALLIKEGLSNKEIAQKLHITERTVKAHISAIFERTGTSDRLSLALYLNDG